MHHLVKHLLTTSKSPQSRHASGLTGIQPFGLPSIQPFYITGTRPSGLTGIRPFGLPGIQPVGLATIRPHRFCLLGSSPGTPGHGQPITSTGRFSRNSWATDGQFCLLGSSLGTPGSRTTNHVYWEVLQELLGHGRSILFTGKFSRNSRVTKNQSRLLGGSPGTPRPQTVNFVYWEVLQELSGHRQPITSTRRFSRNSWATVNFVYWEVLQELPGHGQPITSTGKFSRNSWVTDKSRLLGSSLIHKGPTTRRMAKKIQQDYSPKGQSSSPSTLSHILAFFQQWRLSKLRTTPSPSLPQQPLTEFHQAPLPIAGFTSLPSSGVKHNHGEAYHSLGTPGPRTVNHVYWEVLQELLGHGRSISSTGMLSRNSWVTEDHSRLLGGSSGTPGPQMVNFVYWEVLQEPLGHGQSFTPTGRAETLQYTPDLGVGVPFAGTSPSPPGKQPNGQSLKIIERVKGEGERASIQASKSDKAASARLVSRSQKSSTETISKGWKISMMEKDFTRNKYSGKRKMEGEEMTWGRMVMWFIDGQYVDLQHDLRICGGCSKGAYVFNEAPVFTRDL
ncbi:hypothetical protein V8G54_031395 [Vigna mungo]|uniref:Uncharacterized protein n=1 Tax=Vigna mungo TaxID=3915 RepID=A0AAQ3MYI7_VIGMU